MKARGAAAYPTEPPFSAFHLPPFWTILPPWQSTELGESKDRVKIIVDPGAGFGTGRHPTTQLCMQAIGLMAPRTGSGPWRMLDFGSGSGILSLAAARLGATEVDGVEIDEAAIANAETNAKLNGVGQRIRFQKSLEPLLGRYDWVIGNILRPVLLDFAEILVDRLAPGGTLLLSGLVGSDVPSVSVRYASLLQGRQPEIYRRDDWRALFWRPAREPSG